MFDMLMNEYGMSFFEVKKLTIPQMLLLQRKINIRKDEHNEFIAKVHGCKFKKSGLDTSNAIAIEDMLSGNGGFTM